MRRIIIALVLMAACLVPQDSSAQISLGFGLGTGGEAYTRMPYHARRVLHDYLQQEYHRTCHYSSKYRKHGKREKLPEICHHRVKAQYSGSSLYQRGHNARPLPQKVLRQLGFIQPGTDYRQDGFVVYLVSIPRYIILDSVTVNDREDEDNDGIRWNVR